MTETTAIPHRELVPFGRDGADDTRAAGATRQRCFDVGETSRWFDTLVIGELAARASDGARVYADAEVWYQLTAGSGELVLPDGSVERLRRFDSVFFRAGDGAELRAGDDGLTWLVFASTGGQRPTPYSASEGRGDGTWNALDGASAPLVFLRRTIAPRQWPGNPLGASPKPWWFYTVDESSDWFHSACVSCVAPGGASTFHTHMERYEGPYETWYIVLAGTALIRSEFGDALFDAAPSGVFVPADASHQIINSGEDLLWYYTVSSRGDAPLALDTYSIPSGVERPGYLEEYNRIVAARAARGLQVP